MSSTVKYGFSESLGNNTASQYIGHVYLIFLTALLFTILPAGLSWEFKITENIVEGSIVRKFQWGILFFYAFALAMKVKFSRFRDFIFGNIFVWLFFGFSSFSVLWSEFPLGSFRQAFQFFGILIICYVVGLNAVDKLQSLCFLIFCLLILVLVLSVFWIIFDPTQGLESAVGIEGAWRGILDQKNTLGMVSGVALLFWAYVQTTSPLPYSLSFGSLFLIFVCLLGSRSSSSLFFGLVAVGVYFSLYKKHIRMQFLLIRFSLFFFAVFIAFNILFFFMLNRFLSFSDIAGPFSSLFGKSSDLTGRAYIWVLMWDSISQHWVLGAGLASFWLGPGGPSQFISDALRLAVPTAHNGYLEVLNELGFFGGMLFLGMLIFHIRNIILIFNVDRSFAALTSAIFLIFIVSNFSESIALRITGFLTFLLFFTMMAVLSVRIKAAHLLPRRYFRGAE